MKLYFIIVPLSEHTFAIRTKYNKYLSISNVQGAIIKQKNNIGNTEIFRFVKSNTEFYKINYIMIKIAEAPKINPKSIVFNEIIKEISISEDNKNKLQRVILHPKVRQTSELVPPSTELVHGGEVVPSTNFVQQFSVMENFQTENTDENIRNEMKELIDIFEKYDFSEEQKSKFTSLLTPEQKSAYEQILFK